LAQEHHAAGPLSDEELIKSAESAAPMAIAKEATIIALTAEGKIRTIRKGTNSHAPKAGTSMKTLSLC
jgi:hypothetical protein